MIVNKKEILEFIDDISWYIGPWETEIWKTVINGIKYVICCPIKDAKSREPGFPIGTECYGVDDTFWGGDFKHCLAGFNIP